MPIKVCKSGVIFSSFITNLIMILWRLSVKPTASTQVYKKQNLMIIFMIRGEFDLGTNLNQDVREHVPAESGHGTY